MTCEWNTEATQEKSLCQEITGLDVGTYRTFPLHPDFMLQCWSCKETKEVVFACSNCKIAKYCSKACQKKDWNMHKPACFDVHGVSWIMRVFADNEKAFFQRGISSNRFIEAKNKQAALEGKDLRGCLPTAQILSGLLTDYRSGYFKAYEKMVADLNSTANMSIECFLQMLKVQALLQNTKQNPTSLIYSCAVVGVCTDPDIVNQGEGEERRNNQKYGKQFFHHFTITQYGPVGVAPTYRLWQAYSLGVDKLLYSLNDWFESTFPIVGVHDCLRREMVQSEFETQFLEPLEDMCINQQDRSAKWKSLFGWGGLPDCQIVLLFFKVGHAYRYRLHWKEILTKEMGER